MDRRHGHRARGVLIWGAVAVAATVPIVLATQSPYLAFRDPIYIASGFAGILAMVLILMQPLLAGGLLPGLSGYAGRRVHRWVGVALVACVIVHVGGLWITSPPDVIDALLFVSPTLFSAWGVIAMWAVFCAAGLALIRKSLPIRPWRLAHSGLAMVTVTGSVVHALLIEGTMETISKIGLCLLVLVAAAKVLVDLRAWARRPRRQT